MFLLLLPSIKSLVIQAKLHIFHISQLIWISTHWKMFPYRFVIFSKIKNLYTCRHRHVDKAPAAGPVAPPKRNAWHCSKRLILTRKMWSCQKCLRGCVYYFTTWQITHWAQSGTSNSLILGTPGAFLKWVMRKGKVCTT